MENERVQFHYTTKKIMLHGVKYTFILSRFFFDKVSSWAFFSFLFVLFGIL